MTTRSIESVSVMLTGLCRLQGKYSGLISNTRGRGLMCAFDMATPDKRKRLRTLGYEQGVVLLGCGPSSIRFRPSLNITREEVEEGLSKIDTCLARLN